MYARTLARAVTVKGPVLASTTPGRAGQGRSASLLTASAAPLLATVPFSRCSAVVWNVVAASS